MSEGVVAPGLRPAVDASIAGSEQVPADPYTVVEPSKRRVARLRIESFRGVPARLEIDLRPRLDADPVSLVLFGDNGSGKSSIADALEFVLRASLLRTLDPDRPIKRHARSFAVDTKPYVELEYEDGTRIGRGAPGKDRHGHEVRRVDQPEPAFGLAPIVLRRADILGFWSLPPERRKLVFFDYFRAPSLTERQKLDAARVVRRLAERETQAQHDIDRARTEVARTSGIDARQIPRGYSRLRTFYGEKLKPKFMVKQPKRSGGFQYRMEPPVYSAYQDLLRATLDLQRIQRSKRLNLARADGVETDRVQQEVQAILEEAGDLVTSSFAAISRSAGFVANVILVSSPDSNELTVVLELTTGDQADPADVLSEANLDLLALLVFCAIVRACADHGQAKVLVLDDVFQSVDGIYRQRACRYIAETFRDWQLVLTTHDRLWFSVLADTLRQAGMLLVTKEIVRWDFETGPVVRDALLRPDAGLRRAMDAADPVATCSAAGLLLEEIADRLSWTLGTSIKRRKNDRYSLGDLWPGVAKQLRRLGAPAEVDAVDESLIFRNLVGAHFNEWARSVSTAEACGFGEAVLNLLALCRCDQCHQWVTGDGAAASSWRCRCGAVRMGDAS